MNVNTKLKRFCRKAISSMLVLAMVLSLLSGIGINLIPSAYAVSVSTQQELEAALARGETDITINGKLTLSSKVTIDHSVTISGGTIIAAWEGHKFTTASEASSNYTRGGCMISITGGDVTFTDITIDAQSQTQCIGVSGPANITLGNNTSIENGRVTTSRGGAGISMKNTSRATLKTTGTVTFLNNSAEIGSSTSGGALFVGTGNEAYLDNVSFEGNSAHSGGAIYTYQGTVICTANTTFTGNYAGQRGGAIHSHGTVILDGTTISGTSDQFGGAIYISQDALFSGKVVLNNATVTGSSAANSGGAIYVASNAELYIGGSTTVTGNVVDEGSGDSTDSNINTANETAKIYVYSALSGGENHIGVSTNNPKAEKHIVWSIGSPVSEAGLAGKTVSACGNSFTIPADYIMTEDSDMKVFVYDSEHYYATQSDVQETDMWLQSNESPVVVFDFNIPGAEAVYTEPGSLGTLKVGDTVTCPSVSDQSLGSVTLKFLGWYTEAEGGTKLDSTVEVKAGTQIYYAQWDIQDNGGGGGTGGSSGSLYNVYWDYNFPGQGPGTAVTSGLYGTAKISWYISTTDGYARNEKDISIAWSVPERPVREGYTWKGWATTPTAMTGTMTPANPGGPETFYGVWQANTYALTWNANGGQGGTTTSQKYDETIVPPSTEPTRTGYTFAGWYIDKNCTIPLASGLTVQGNQTFYASWTAEKVVVNYYDTREGTSLVFTQTYDYGDKFTSLDAMSDTSGQHFIRWATENGQASTSIGNLISSVPLEYVQGGNGADVSSDAGYWKLDLYAVWQEITTDYLVTISWNDLSNNDGCRPQSIKVGLISSVTDEVVDEATVTGTDDVWTYTFTDLPITTADTSVEKITYDVYMIGYTDCDGTYRAIKDTAASSGEIQGATASNYDDAVYSTYRYAINNYSTGAAASAYSGDISLDHDLITTRDDIQFSIQWDDESNNDGMRPKAVTLVLYADGVPVQERPLHNSGTGVASVSSSNCLVSDDGDVWTYTFQDYQKYNNGKAITYTVAVKNDDQATTFNENGYTTRYLNSTNPTIGDTDGAIITRPIDLVDKTVTIHWDDESNRDGQRPETVTITLYAYQWNNKTYRWEQTMVDTADITGGATVDTWTHTFQDVKKYNGGTEIIYKAIVTSDLNAQTPPGDNGYSAVSNELDIVISHNRNVKSLPVTIEWGDEQNNDNIRPATVIVQLYADGVKLEGTDYAVLVSGDSTADNWSYTFNNLPVYRDGVEGEEIIYTISVEEAVEESIYGTYFTTANGQEEEIVRYTASYMDATGSTTAELAESMYPYVKLTHETDQGTVNLYASWHDEQNRDGKRPSSILVDLYKQVDGVREFTETVTITAGKDNSWTYKITGLPLYENGHEVMYLAEVSDDFRENLKDNYGYTVSMEGPAVHLYYTPAVGFVTGQIHWLDNDNNDGARPDCVMATLYANGKSTGKTIELNELNNWTYTWQDVESYYNNNGVTGTPVVYSIVVEAPDGYYVQYVPETTTTIDPTTIIINLSDDPDTIALTGTIYWNDQSDQDGIRPDQVKIQLYADGEKVVGQNPVVTGDGDVWTYEFQGLPKYNNGEEIYYTIKPDDNVTKTYDDLTAGMNLYLSHNAAAADMTVAFRWSDADNADGVRPEALYLTLTANGVPVDGADYQRTVYFDVDGVTWTFYDLPVYSIDGEKISYNATVEFDPLFGSVDYQVSASRDIQLSTTNANLNQIIITLSKTSDTGMETGHVFWFDNNNQRGNRPTTLTVNLYNDNASYVVGTYTIDSVSGKVTDAKGTEVGTVEVSEWGSDGSSCWTYTISGLVQNSIYNGAAHEIYYYTTARTTGIANWYTVIDGQANGMDINLTHVHYLDDVGSSQQDFTVEINWMDNDDAWDYRPDANGVDITLYANGVKYKTIHMTQSNVSDSNANSWSYTFEDLPTYLNGAAVVWTAEIGDVDKYTPTVLNYSDYAVIKMTQSIGFDFTVRWDDSDDDDAARPDSITVDVYGDGTKVGTVTLTGTGNVWTAEVHDLPVWREAGPSVAVSYSFRWSDDTGAELIDNYYNASATKGGTPVDADTFYYLSATEWGSLAGGLSDLTNQYQWETTLQRNKETRTVYADILWNDDANRDGIRPEYVLVQLYANGEPLGEPTKLTGESTASSWPISWELQDVYEGGKPIVYTASVVDVPTGYAASVDTTGTQITLSHDPQTVDVTGTMIWADATELNYVYNSLGDLIETYSQIKRAPVYMQLLLNGEAYGDPVRIPTSVYDLGEGDHPLAVSAAVTWDNVFVYANEGETNVYTIRVYSTALDALLADGHSLAYNFEEAYAPTATVTHDLYDVRGTVYYLYDTSDDFLLSGVKVTAYLYDEATQTYIAVGSATTDANGKYEILNIPQGMLTIRATYEYGDYTYAGSMGVKLDRHDTTVNLIVNRDADSDSDLYRYEATGKAFYQTDITDSSTIHAVPAGSVVLLYKVVDKIEDAQYLSMTTTDDNGKYSFGKLADGTYLVNVVFNYGDGTYTYDNDDAVADGLSFVIHASDATWPDIIKQVNAIVDPNDPDVPVIPDEPDPVEPEPCIVDGSVFFSDNGVHTTEPVADVDVYIYAADSNALVGSTTTDADGHWVVEGLGVGEYIAVFTYAANASRVLHFSISETAFKSGTYTAATQYFDRQSDVSTATIRGVVLDEEGNQFSALVQITNENGEIAAIGYTDKNGFYSFTVPSGFTYTTKILEVSTDTKTQRAGDPDDTLTTLEYYTISGNFSISGAPQAGSTVALYKEDIAGNFNLLTATLTNTSGDYTLKVTDAGNYRVTMYRDGQAYESKYVSVGYQEYEPVVTAKGNGVYVISGSMPSGAFDSAVLLNTTTNVVKTEATLGQNTSYSFEVAAGTYKLNLTKDGQVTTYYIDAPDNVTEVNYFVTVAGEAVDENGAPILGAIVTLLDSEGNQVREQTIITNGKYSYANLPADTYTVQIDYPVAGNVLANKATTEPDSYNQSYPDGMTPGSVWSWNINAVTVSGTVKDQNGVAIPGATVVLKMNNDPDKAYGVLTDADGNWNIGVMNGNYTADAMYEFDVDHIYHSTQQLPVLVNGEDFGGVDFIINRYTLDGNVVRDGDNVPVAGAEVTITYPDGTVVWTGTTDENGEYSAILLPDTYTVKVDYVGATAQATVKMDQDKDLTLKVSLPITITGTVYDVDGTTPVADGIVYYSGTASGKVYTDDDGTYTIALTAAQLGTYTLYAEAAGNTSAKIPVNVTTNTVQNLTLTRVAESERIVSGIVVDNDGNRLANAIVTLVYGNDKTKVLTTSTDSNGVYRFYVPDGTYYLTADYESANGYTYSTNGETAVHLDGEDKTDANLTISLSYNVTVTVVDTEGNETAGATVRFSGASTGTTITGDDGTAIVKIAGGDYTFFATVGNRVSEKKTVEISKATNITLVVGQTGIAYEEPDVESTDYTISGYVLTPDGDPVSDVNVTLYKFNLVSEVWETVDTDLTNGSGYYEFTGLDDGRYRVDYDYTLSTSNVSSEIGYYVINGYALDDSDNPYVAATVNLYNSKGQLVNTVYTNKDGFYQFSDMAMGEYTIEIIPAPDDNANTQVLNNVTPTAGSAVIEGTVLDVNGDPVEGATVTVSGPAGTWTMLTKADGLYSFEVPDDGDYTVTITYPVSYRVDTDTYENDSSDPIAPELTADSFVISGYVHDTDENVIVGATVKLLDASGAEIDRTTSNSDGFYEFTGLKPGSYTVVVEYKTDSQEYDVDANGKDPNGGNDTPTPPVALISVEGVVVTDHKTPLPGAIITVRNTDTDETVTIIADQDGRFDTGDLDRGRYELIATYTHKYGTNESEPVYFNRSQDDAALVIVLSYVADVNGDGSDETVYAGEDDTFDTPDDFYQDDIDGNGIKENIYAGEDGKPGTKDDYYNYDVNGDGDDETVYVGDDRIPGTEDDYYLADPDKDGADENIYAGDDGLPGTKDDYYEADLDGDSNDDTQVNVGGDTVPGTPDDNYQADPDNDGKDETVYVGEDGIPGTDDDWYYDDSGNKTPIGGVYVNFDANGGTVNGKDIYSVKKDSVRSLPSASQTGYRFDGWFTAAEGGTQITMSTINAQAITTTYYAHWTKTTVDPPEPITDIQIAGAVVTNNGTGLNSATVTIRNTATGATKALTAGADGTFDTGVLVPGTYELTASYTHKYGTNTSEPVTFKASTDNAQLVITLSYDKDINGDGVKETIYAGADDTFDTPDDYYLADVLQNGTPEKVYAGEDGKPGTADDYYLIDADGDGKKDDKVFAGDDGKIGTPDDYYLTDADNDGEIEKVYVGKDTIPLTPDDWYESDPNKDGKDEQVFVGPDGKPGTEDDYYEGQDDPQPGTDIQVSGIVKTDNGTILGNAQITVRDTATGQYSTLKANDDGTFDTGVLPAGKYEVTAEITNSKGQKNVSTPLVVTTTTDNAELIIILSYTDDVNNDGKYETIYAGTDDTFDTLDDYTKVDLDGDGQDETKVYVGDDSKPLTEDDYYPADLDGSGQNDTPVYAGKDKTPGTKDDYYMADLDGNGEDETKVYVGDDTKPGTKDDWYMKDQDNDGEEEKTYVGEDGKPNTDDDWYDNDGEQTPVGKIYINFNANGGKVNGQSVSTILQGDLRTLPNASRSSYTFNGWYTAPTGGVKLTLADIKDLPITTTVYAQWTYVNTNPVGPGSGSGTGSGSGSGSGGTINPNPPSNGNGSGPGGIIVIGSTVPEQLTTDHIAYIVGRNDGLVHPTANITRAEVAMIFYRLLTSEARTKYETSSCSYPDVASNAWYATAVATLSKMGIITGASDGKFHPNDNITRAELATIAARFDNNTYTGVNKFSDINGHWAAEYINRAAARGWVQGSNGKFRPNDAITRAEVMTLVNNVLGRSTIKADSLLNTMKTWPDNMDTSKWYYLAVQEATNGHDYSFESGYEVWTAVS